MDLSAVVTGAGRGIGRAVAVRLAADGYQVVACGRTGSDLDKLAATRDGITACVADVSDEHDVERVAARAEELGRLGVWINNAAMLERVPFVQLSISRWRAQMSVNLDGVFLGTHVAFLRMRDNGGGVIVNLGSLSGVAHVEKFPGLAAYNVAKAGVIALTEAVALEGREHGVRCVCVSPGAVATDMLRKAAPHLRPGMTPEDMAAIVAFLVSPAAAPLSGTNIPIFSNA